MSPAKGGAVAPKKVGKVGMKKKSKGPTSYWDSLAWQAIDTGDDILTGAEEGGFAGLEIIEDPTILDPAVMSRFQQGAHVWLAWDFRCAPAWG